MATESIPVGAKHAGRGRLITTLGVGFGIAVAIGNTIGAGIVRTPGEIAALLPSTWLYFAAWAAGGIYMSLGALQFAELGALLPQSGGQYNFARAALGDYAGFIVGWSDWISTAGSFAAVSIVFGEYTARYDPGGARPRAGACRRSDFAVCAAAMEKHEGGQRRARPDHDFEGRACFWRSSRFALCTTRRR